MKQKAGLEKELADFLATLFPAKDIVSASPSDIVNFLIWKDNFGKTMVHRNGCRYFGKKTRSVCHCPKRLAYGPVDDLIGKLRSIFSAAGRGTDLKAISDLITKKLNGKGLSACQIYKLARDQAFLKTPFLRAIGQGTWGE